MKKNNVRMLCSALALTALLAGCGGTPAASTPTPAVNQEAATADDVFVVYHDTKVAMGMKYADVKDGLGEESKPADVITPCDGTDSIKDTMHFYGKLAVTEDRDGIIKGLDLNSFYEGETESKAAFMGKVTLGDKEDTVKEAMGESQGDDPDFLEYTVGSVRIGVSLDTDTRTVTSVSVYVL